MRNLLLVLSLLSTAKADDWTPPENPNPSMILREAGTDADTRKYDVALAKQIWYHENAVRLEPAQSGVRLSFALAQWLELGESYPPALEKLIQIRDETEKKIRDEKRIRVRFEDFHDFTALNKTLRQEQRTVELFRWLSETDPEDAKRMYYTSEPALIKHKEYELCGKYIDPEKDIARIGESYTLGLTMSKRFGQSHQDFIKKKLINDAAMLVAILVKNDRLPEAREAAEELRGLVTDAKLSRKLTQELDAAMNGAVPTPWP